MEAARFTAGIYSSAGFADRALKQLRRAEALAPRDGDTLVQLAEALKGQGQLARAVAMLQARAAAASDDDALAAALGGLATIFAPDPDRPPPPSVTRMARARLGWAQRRVLERIVQVGASPRLLGLLGEIAQARGDFALQVRTYAAQLPGAGDQRCCATSWR